MPPSSDVEFSFQTYTFDMVLMTPKPAAVSPFWNLVKPYTPLVWGSVLACYAIVAAVYCLTNRALEGRLDPMGVPVMLGPMCSQCKP